jgi:hypothetical protein
MAEQIIAQGITEQGIPFQKLLKHVHCCLHGKPLPAPHHMVLRTDRHPLVSPQHGGSSATVLKYCGCATFRRLLMLSCLQHSPLINHHSSSE